ncbi:hypothetical protein MOQ72_28125 [Saccharopolyspora sp. K220]|uniref:hypothetical protein n=1 Tax=Saccharopolyspora soli TaxID=2926618 RepID=UPI001F57E898|nr:hypothetical protein [Saccharopolyspora soli]MCI2421316.1 hypothetical protein [Saccharopolyspora soli]
MSQTAGRPPTGKALTSTVAGLSIVTLAAIVGILVHFLSDRPVDQRRQNAYGQSGAAVSLSACARSQALACRDR